MVSRFSTLCLLAAISATALVAQPTVTSLSPTRNDTNATLNSNLDATFSNAMATPGSNDIRVFSNLRGNLAGSVSGGGSATLSFDPNSDMLPGEQINVTLTDALQQQGGSTMANPVLWQFRAAAGQGPASFTKKTAATSLSGGWGVKFGDLDGDGDMDMVGVTNGQNYYYLNDGNGNFSGTTLGTPGGNYSCAFADLDADGDLDIITVGSPVSTSTGQLSGQNYIYWNDGSAGFSVTTNLGPNTSYSIDVDTGDIDGDGDLDIVVANGSVQAEANDIYVNDGSGNFTRKGVLWVTGSTTEFTDNCWSVRLADADNDGDLDLFTANFDFSPTESTVFYNNGSGDFVFYQGSSTIGPLGIALGMAVADFNGDGYVDVAYGNLGQPAMGTSNRITVCWNNGSGAFTTTSVAACSSSPYGPEAADVDGDGDMDLAIGVESGQSFIMLNSGTAFTSTTAIGSTSSTAHGLAFADIDGDGDLDCASPARVYFNGSNKPGIAVTSNSATVADGATLNVNYGDSLASLGFGITISDADSDPVGLSTQITNSTTQGFNTAQWSATNGSTPYSLGPNSGVFNQASVTHDFILTATDDGGDYTTFTFHVSVGTAPNTAPTITVASGGSSVNNAGVLNVSYGDSLASLSLAITADDAQGDSVTLAGSVSNTSGTGILNSEFSNSAATPYTLNPGTGTFNQGSVTHVVTLNADDGNGGASSFSFSIVVGPAPAPSIEVFETVAGGTQISHGANASGNRNFGSQLIAAGPTAALTVVIHNAGNANLTVTSVSLSGNAAGQFVLNTGSLTGTVTPNGDDTFTIAFDPTTTGSKVATVNIVHDDGSVATPFTFEVSGVGTAPAPAPIIVVTENGNTVANGSTANGGRAFGTLLVGSPSAPLTITVSNAGNADLTVGAPAAFGADAGMFSVTGSGATIPAGTSATFTITYLATTVGVHSATISFSHDDTSTTTPFSFDLSGTTDAAAQASGGSGSGSGSGGGCVAGTSMSFIGLLFLALMAMLAVVRNRRVEN